MSLHRIASRKGPVFAGLAALALVIVSGQSAPSTAVDTAQARLGPAVVDSHPYSASHQRMAPLVKVSRPSDARQGPGPQGIRQHRLPELEPAGRDAGSGSARALAPRVSSTPLSSGSVLRTDFDGIDEIQNSSTAGFPLEPPDEGLGAGNGYVANFVNVTGAIYNTHGGMVQGPFYLNTFFGEAPEAYTSDPRVYYDYDTGRWFATILEYSFNNDFTAITESHIDIAVSKHSDPTGAWRIYQVDASSPSHGGCPCLGDYPILGVDGTNIYISTQEFTSDLSSYNGAQLYILPKSELTAGASSVHLATFDNLEAGGSLGYRVQFANTLEPSPAEFAMSTLDPTGAGDNRIVVWAVTRRGAVARGGTPTLSTRVISSEGYFPQPLAETPQGFCTLCDAPTTGLLDAGSDTMFETEFIDGNLVGAMGTGVNVAGDSGPRAGIGWVVVSPHVRSTGTVGGSTHVARQGYVATRGLDLMYPHLNMTGNHSMALGFSFTGPNTFPSAATSVAAPGSDFGRIRLVEAGVTADDGFTATENYGGVGRWGDYSNGQLVGHSNRVWLATQYIPNEGDGYANWGNRIWKLRLR